MKCRQVTNLSCRHYDVNQVSGNRAGVANQDHNLSYHVHRDFYIISTQVHDYIDETLPITEPIQCFIRVRLCPFLKWDGYGEWRMENHALYSTAMFLQVIIALEAVKCEIITLN